MRLIIENNLLVRAFLFLSVFNLLIFHSAISQCLVLTVPPDVTICEPADVPLNGSINGNYFGFQWTSNLGFFDNTNLNTSAFVNSTTTFTLTGYGDPNANIIVNGDFSSGNTGFTTDYTLSSPSYTCPNGNHVYGVLGCEGVYVIGPNSGPTHTNFSNCYDHTGGGDMMMVNGAASLQNIWCQTVSVFPNTTYIFEAYATSLNSSSPAILQFSIDNVLLGSPFALSGSPCSWEQFYTTWNSGSSTSVTICVTNQNTAGGGNDFALDDIFFAPLCEESLSFTVTYEPFDVSIPGLYYLDCNNPATTIEAIPLPHNNGYGFAWETLDGITGPDLTSPTLDVLSTGTYQVTVTDANLCTRVTDIYIDGNFDIPIVEILGDTLLNCTINSTELYLDGIDGNDFVQWTFPDNNTQAGAYITTDQTGVYNVVVTDINGCSNSDQIEVIFDQNLIEFRIDSIGKLTCKDTLVPIILEISSPYTSIAWPTAGVDTVLNNGLMAIVRDTGYYTITIGLGPNCSKEETIHIGEIPPLFNYTVNPVDIITCTSPKINMQVQTSNENVIHWSESNVIFENGNYFVDTPGKYHFAVTDSLGCIRLDSTEVFANIAIPSVDIRVDSIDCSDNKGGFFVDNIDATSWYWLPGGQFNNETYAEFGNEGAYTMVVEGANGCADTLIVDLPTNVTFPEITASITHIDCNQPLGTVEILANGNLNIVWQTTSGMNGNGSLVTSIESTQVSVTATDPQGCIVTENFTINIDTIAPKLQIAPLDTINCILTSVKPKVTATDYTEINWQNVSNNQESALEPNLTEPGMYTLTLKNYNGCMTTQSIEVFEDKAKPSLSVTVDTLTCAAPTSLLNVLGMHNESMLIKYPNDSVRAFAPNILLSEAGVYSLLATALNGCDTLIEFTVLEDKDLPNLFVEDANLDCNIASVTLTNTFADPDIINYIWKDVNGAVVGNEDSLTVKNGAKLTLEAINSNGCADVFGPIVVHEDRVLPNGLITGDTLLTCKDSVLTILFASSIDPIEIQWFQGQNLLGTEPSIDIDLPGHYTVNFRNLINGCDDTQSVDIALAPIIETTNFSITEPECYGDIGTIVIENVEGGTAPFLLRINESIVDFDTDIDANYGVNSIYIEDKYGCQFTADFDIYTPFPIHVDAGKDTLIQRGETYILQPAYSSNVTNLSWESAGDLSCSDCDNPMVNPTVSTVYHITVYDQNGCASEDNVEVRVRFDKGYTAPNIMHTNSALNNAFTLYSKYKSIGLINDLSIYDRWGNMVFKQNEFMPDDPKLGWNGMYHGVPVVQGVYVWYANVTYVDGSEETVAGDITVIR